MPTRRLMAPSLLLLPLLLLLTLAACTVAEEDDGDVESTEYTDETEFPQSMVDDERIEEVKRAILDALGLKAPPDNLRELSRVERDYLLERSGFPASDYEPKPHGRRLHRRAAVGPALTRDVIDDDEESDDDNDDSSRSSSSSRRTRSAEDEDDPRGRTLERGFNTRYYLLEGASNWLKDDGRGTFFNISSSQGATIDQAYVNFRLLPIPMNSDDGLAHYSVHIYKYLSDGELDTEPIIVEERSVDPREEESRFEKISITSLARIWQQKPNSNHGILVKVLASGNSGVADDYVERSSESLFIHMLTSNDFSDGARDRRSADDEAPDPTARKRKPRSTTLSPKGSSDNALPLVCGDDHSLQHCCLRNFVVNFTQMGWKNFIIAPSYYNAFSCSGRCSTMTRAREGALHSKMAAQITEAASKMCCVPERLGSLHVAVHLGTTFTTQYIPSMMALSCGCT